MLWMLLSIEKRDMRVESFTHIKDYLLKLYTVKNRCLDAQVDPILPLKILWTSV